MIPDEQLFVDRGNQNMVFYFVKINDISLKRELRKINDYVFTAKLYNSRGNTQYDYFGSNRNQNHDDYFYNLYIMQNNVAGNIRNLRKLRKLIKIFKS